MDAYATSDGFEVWLRKPVSLTAAERAWLDDALSLAAVLIRNNVDMADADADRLLVAKWVSCEIVADPFVAAWDRRNLRSWSESMGPFVESVTVDNPKATLVFTEAHRAMFPGMRVATAPRWQFGEGCV